jgi:hypothetical protein
LPGLVKHDVHCPQQNVVRHGGGAIKVAADNHGLHRQLRGSRIEAAELDDNFLKNCSSYWNRWHADTVARRFPADSSL